MQKKITIVVFRNHNARIPFLSISTCQLLGMLGILAALFAALIAVSLDYGNLKEAQKDSYKLQQTLAMQKEEIAQQQCQIQFFTDKINKLKSYLMAVNQVQKKIGMIANIEASPHTTGLFAIGGSVPDDAKSQHTRNPKRSRVKP